MFTLKLKLYNYAKNEKNDHVNTSDIKWYKLLQATRTNVNKQTKNKNNKKIKQQQKKPYSILDLDTTHTYKNMPVIFCLTLGKNTAVLGSILQNLCAAPIMHSAHVRNVKNNIQEPFLPYNLAMYITI